MSYDSLCLVIAPLQSPLHCWRLSTVHFCCLFWYDSYLPVITADITGRAHCWMYVRITAQRIFTYSLSQQNPHNRLILSHILEASSLLLFIVPTSRVLWYAPRRSETPIVGSTVDRSSSMMTQKLSLITTTTNLSQRKCINQILPQSTRVFLLFC